MHRRETITASAQKIKRIGELILADLQTRIIGQYFGQGEGLSGGGTAPSLPWNIPSEGGTRS